MSVIEMAQDLAWVNPDHSKFVCRRMCEIHCRCPALHSGPGHGLCIPDVVFGSHGAQLPSLSVDGHRELIDLADISCREANSADSGLLGREHVHRGQV